MKASVAAHSASALNMTVAAAAAQGEEVENGQKQFQRFPWAAVFQSVRMGLKSL